MMINKRFNGITSKGRMGSEWIPDGISIGNFNLIHESSKELQIHLIHSSWYLY